MNTEDKYFIEFLAGASPAARQAAMDLLLAYIRFHEVSEAERREKQESESAGGEVRS